MTAAVRYAEHLPSQRLGKLVACGWTLTCGQALPDHRVLPDGCMDVLVVAGREPVVAGTATTAFVSPMAAGAFAAGIRFRPGCAPAVLGIGAAELRDRNVALSEIWGRALTAGIAEAPDARSALALLHAALVARLPGAGAADRAVLAAVDLLAEHPNARVADVARAVGLGGRQLHRRFHDHVGYGPKLLGRVLRLQRLLAGPPEPWAQRAFAAGYADQAHMTRDCVALAGVPPTRLQSAA